MDILPEGDRRRRDAAGLGDRPTQAAEGAARPSRPAMPVATGVELDPRHRDPGAGQVAQVAPAGAAPGTGRRPRRRGPGRDLPAAILVGVSLAAVVVLSLVLRKEAFIGIVTVAMCVALHELAQALATRRITVPLVPLLIGSIGMQVSAYTGGEEGLFVAFVLTVLGVVAWRALEAVEGAVRDVAAAIFSAAYLPFLGGFAVLMLVQDDGPLRIVVFVLTTVASDIGGYVFGVLWGRHPMAPSVSPKKSWEGSAGSAVFTVAAGVAGVVLLLDGPWWVGLVLGLAVTVTATVGDLSESLLKRDIGIKDMGSLLPGHGGLMDRLDSLLLTAPVTYLLLAALVPVAA